MLKDYLKSRLGVIILLIVVEGIFASSYFLFDMPAVTVLYPLVLGFAAIVIAGIIDFLITLDKHKKLAQRDFPEPSGVIEKDYREIMARLKEEEEFSRQKANADYNRSRLRSHPCAFRYSPSIQTSPEGWTETSTG